MERSRPTGHLDASLASIILSATADVILVVDGDGVLSWVNEATETMLGYPPAAFVGSSPLSLIHPDDRDFMVARLGEVWAAPWERFEPVTMRVSHADGHWVTVEAAGVRQVDVAGVRGVVVVLRDVSARIATELQLHEANERLLHAQSYDRLTKLPNRELLLDYAEGLRQRLVATSLFVIVVRVCNLDEIRDRYGFEDGEGILRTLAWSLRAEVRPEDFVAADRPAEFVVVPSPATSISETAVLAERLRSVASQPLSVSREPVEVVLSVGFSTLTPGESVADVLDEAGVAARWACIRPEHRVVQFDESMRVEVRERRVVAKELAAALRRDQLELHYQPILNISTSEIEGFEALLRWRHPDRGLLAAGSFLEAVEGTALMVDIGDFVLRTGVAQLGDWQRRFGPRAPSMSINVSARQLRDRGFAADVARELLRSGAPAGALIIELTETYAVDREADALREVRELRTTGVRLALDDFGTGYSSLHHLQAIAADCLKIDRTFVAAMEHDDGAAAIVRAALELSDAFGMRAVAEGVETRGQRQLLADLGCPALQGFIVSPAVPADQAVELFDQRFP